MAILKEATAGLPAAEVCRKHSICAATWYGWKSKYAGASVMQEYPKLNIVGEEWSPHPAVVSYWQRGKKNHDGYVSHAPSLMDFPMQTNLLAALLEEDGPHTGLTKLYEGLAHDFVYPDPANLVLFDGNHDTPRLFSVLKLDVRLS